MAEENLRVAFDNFDTDKDGTISRQELHKILSMGNKNVKDEHVDQVIARCDRNRDGVIQFEEFV